MRDCLRIVLVVACPFPWPQGSQVFTGQMAEQLAVRGHQVALLTYGQGSVVAESGYTHHRVRRLPGDDTTQSGPHLIKPVLDLLMLRRLGRLLAGQTFDIVHCHNYEAAMVGLAARRWFGTPVVYHSHNLMMDELPSYFRSRAARSLATWCGLRLDGQVPRRTDHVIALCDYSAAQLRSRGVDEDRLSVIPPAVTDSDPGGSRDDARSSLGLSLARFVVGYCGNLDGYQNLGILEAVLRQLAKRGLADRYLWLLITHETGQRCEALLRRLRRWGACRRTEGAGYEGARLAMRACDALVLPRQTGSGFPIKILNYMSLARPIVTAGCGAKAVRSGIEAIVVPDADAFALCEALERLRCDPQTGHRLGEAARRKFLSDYTWDAVLPRVEEVYDNTLRRRRSSCAATKMPTLIRE